ncbi:MAG TPA: hypothetical protein VH678_05760 [Xanthobacteraceae bacterium]|jgi:hypothetical protein
MAQAESANTTTSPKPSRADRFLARVDAHLSTLSTDGARQSFVASQMRAWKARYAKFVESAGASEPATDVSDPPQAADFLLTITGLQVRARARAVS